LGRLVRDSPPERCVPSSCPRSATRVMRLSSAPPAAPTRSPNTLLDQPLVLPRRFARTSPQEISVWRFASFPMLMPPSLASDGVGCAGRFGNPPPSESSRSRVRADTAFASTATSSPRNVVRSAAIHAACGSSRRSWAIPGRTDIPRSARGTCAPYRAHTAARRSSWYRVYRGICPRRPLPVPRSLSVGGCRRHREGSADEANLRGVPDYTTVTHPLRYI
jgi:hypothetical protein